MFHARLSQWMCWRRSKPQEVGDGVGGGRVGGGERGSGGGGGRGGGGQRGMKATVTKTGAAAPRLAR